MLLPAEEPLQILPAGSPSRVSLDVLVTGAGVSLGAGQMERLARYRDLLFTHNRTTNLTAVRDLPGIERRLILESLRLVEPLRGLPRIDDSGRRSLLDVGTGGGLPGMVLAIACPDFHVFLLDATGKKIAFLDLVVRELQLTNATTIHARAEEVGQTPRYRNGFDVVSARAVSSLPALLEFGLPLLRIGGSMLLPKGPNITDELEAGHRAAAVLGGQIVDSRLLPDCGSTIETRLVTIRKTAPTPDAYPRRAGVPAKSPLGAVRNGRGGS